MASLVVGEGVRDIEIIDPDETIREEIPLPAEP